MQSKLSILFLFCFATRISLNTVLSHPAPENEEDAVQNDGQNNVQREMPIILSKPAIFTVHEGDDVILPCDTTSSFDNSISLIWSVTRPNSQPEFLFFDTAKRIKDDNFSLFTNKSLSIKDVKQKYAGNYSCSYDPKHPITHTLAIKVNITFPSYMKTVYEKNSSINLYCNATGYPEPTVAWYKQTSEGRYRVSDSANFTLSMVKIEDSGTYECEAKNDLESVPTRKEIQITVFEGVTPEQALVYAERSDKPVTLCCNHYKMTDGKKISWTKGDKELSWYQDSRYFPESVKRKSCLTIKMVKEEDLGTYSCRRFKDSKDGEFDSANIVLSGAPHVPVLITYGSHNSSDKSVLKWNVTTYAPLLSKTLYYKKQEDKDWKVYLNENLITVDPVETITYEISDLLSGQYNIKLEVKNKFGTTVFESPGTPLVIDNVEPTVILSEKQQDGGAPSLQLSSLCILFALIVRLWNNCC